MAGTTYKGLVIQFGADTTDLAKKLKGIQGEARNTQADLRQINAALKFNPGNTELLQQKVRKLSESIEQMNSKLKAYKDAQEQLDEKRKRGVELTKEEQDQYDKLTRDILKCENQLDRYGKELAETEREAKASETALYKLGQKVDQNSDKFEKVGKGAQTAGKAMSAAFGGVAAGAVAAFNDMDAGADAVVKQTGAVGEAAEGLQRTMEATGARSSAEWEDIGNTVGMVNTKFGLTGKELEDLSVTFLEFSSNTGTGLETAVNDISNAMTAFGVSTKDTDAVLGLYQKTAQDTGISVDTLIGLTDSNGASFREMGMSLEDSVTWLGQLEKSGVPVESMMTGLKKAATKCAESGTDMGTVVSDLAKRLRDPATQAQATQDAIDLFGSKAALAFIDAASSGRLNLDNLGVDLQGFAGKVNETYEATKDAPDKFKEALHQIEPEAADLGATILNQLVPVVKDAAEFVKSLTEGWNNLSPAQQEIIGKTVIAGAAIGGILTGVGQLIVFIGTLGPAIMGASATFSAFSAVLAANPIVLVVAGITAVVAALTFFFTQTELGREIWAQFTGFLGEAFEVVATFLGEKIEAVKSFFEGLWTKIGEVRDTIGGIFDDLKSRAETAFEGIKNDITEKMNFAKEQAGLACGAIKDVLSGDFEGAARKTAEMFANISRSVQEKLQAARQNAENAGNAIGEVLGFPGLGTKVAGVFDEAKNNITNKLHEAFNAVKDIPGNLARIFSGMNLNLPHFALPHFWVEGGSFPWGIGGQGQPPEFGVRWYAKGAIFTKPTIFPGNGGGIGVGDVPRGEAVLPIERLQTMIDRALARFGGSPTVNVYVNAQIGSNLDAYQVGQQIGRGAESVMKQRGYAA